jgi:hypothetical protein
LTNHVPPIEFLTEALKRRSSCAPAIAHGHWPPCDHPCAPDAAASTASHPAFHGIGWRELVEMICPSGKAKYFLKQNWTAIW